MNLLLIFQSTPGELMPISGYLLCFIPLAAVILGFIIAARYTDRQATSTYLRVLPASETAGAAPGVTADSSTLQRPFLSFMGNELPASTQPPKNPSYAEMIPPIPYLEQPGVAPQVVAPLPAAISAPDIAPPKAQPVPTAPVPTTAVRPHLKVEPPAPAVIPAKEAPAVKPVARVEAAAPAAISVPNITQGVSITYVEWNPEANDRDGEYVLIENLTGASVDMTGWQLLESKRGKSFTFPTFVLPAGAKLRIWTKPGTADASNLYIGSPIAVWHNTGDTATLRDAQGKVVSYWAYEGEKDK